MYDPRKQFKHFNYMSSEIDASYHQAALKLGLSDSAMLVLYAVLNGGDSCLVGDISRLSGVRKQTVNSALRKLEGEGIIRLEEVSGRKKRVCLTERGREFAASTVMRVIQIENEIFAAWSREDREKYLELTQRYLSAFKQKVQEL